MHPLLACSRPQVSSGGNPRLTRLGCFEEGGRGKKEAGFDWADWKTFTFPSLLLSSLSLFGDSFVSTTLCTGLFNDSFIEMVILI